MAATVQRVVSAQTLEVTLVDARPAYRERVRLAGISAPDLQQAPWGKEAQSTLAALLGPRAIVILEAEQPEKDAYGRRLAYVWHNGQLLNETLVARGYALDRGAARPEYRDRLARARDYARVMGYGIWNPQKPLRQTPEEFRRSQQNATALRFSLTSPPEHDATATTSNLP